MAGTGNINESNVSNLSDQQLSRMNAKELDEVLDILKDIKSQTGRLNDEQKKVAASAGMYRRELEKSGNAVNENLNGLQKTRVVLGGIRDIGVGIFDAAKKIVEPWGKVDQAAYDFGKALGGNIAAVERLRDESIKFGAAQHIGIKYNATIGEMIKLQQQLSQTVGRNLQLSNNQRETLLATSKLMGDNTNEFIKKLDNMGVGLEKSGDIAAKMFNEASKSGISFEKYSKSVTDNLTKVQSYGFKNGVEGLTAMAKKAVEVNMSINEAFKVADKIQSGGIQEAIKMSANLQVLGGNFARFGGDPMGLLYQGLNDVEGLQDRMVKMFSGNANIVNGQVKISGADRLRMNAAAQAMGVSSDEMFNMVSRGAVRDRVMQQMGGRFDGDEELKELIANTATLNKQGQAVVNINGEPKTLDKVSSSDKQYLKDLQKSESEDIKDIAQMMRGYMGIQEGAGKEMENQKALMFKGVGEAVKGILKDTAEITGLLHTLITIQTISSVVGAVGGGFRRIRGVARGGKGVAKAGSVTGGVKGAGSGTVATKAAKPVDYVSKSGKAYRLEGGKLINNETGRALTKGAKGYDKALETATKNKASRSLANAGKGSVTKYGGGERAFTRAAAKIGGKTGLKAAQGVAKFAGSTAGKMLGGGAMAGLFAGGMHLLNGDFKGDRATKNEAIGGTIGATIGGAIGQLSNFLLPGSGPFVSMLTGAIGESVGGWIGKKVTARQDKKRSEAKATVSAQLGKNTAEGKAFSNLKGDYSSKELKAIGKALSGQGELNKKLANKIVKNGDNEELMSLVKGDKSKERLGKATEKIKAKVDSGEFGVENANITINNADMPTAEPEVAYARGGKLYGPSDINGPGMPIQGSNIVVGGGEYVVNAEATRRNESLLDRINSGETIRMAEGGVIPVPFKISNILPNILKSPLAPLPVRAAMSAADRLRQKAGGIDKMEVAPIKLDVSGTIKLEAGGQQVDLNAIINNPAFLTQLSQMVERRLADNINGGNFKELKKNKQHTF